MDNKLKDRLNLFLDELEVPITKICKKIMLSPQSLYDWRKDRLKLSDGTLKRIDDYLKKYGF
ncbi:MAG: hypothetical protein II304_01135 [Bacteroidales bacterium]|nr:hypothetical protein [Bacteroidales bacterium]